MLMNMPFTLRLAGKLLSVQTCFPETRQFCGDYLCDGTPEIALHITPEDIVLERETSARQDHSANRPLREYSDTYLETLALYRKIADTLAEHQTLLMHGSAIAVDGMGYLFTAPSGTGKSTHTRLLRELLGNRAVMINDDKPLISLEEDGPRIHGTPWCGKHGLQTNCSIPLKAICILSQGTGNHIEPLSVNQAMPMLLQQIHRPRSVVGMHAVLASLDLLLRTVRLYKLECTPEPQAAEISFAALSQHL